MCPVYGCEPRMTWADPKDRGIALVFQSYALYPTMLWEHTLGVILNVLVIGSLLIWHFH